MGRKKHHVLSSQAHILSSHLMIKFHEYSGYGLPKRLGLSAFHGLTGMQPKPARGKKYGLALTGCVSQKGKLPFDGK